MATPTNTTTTFLAPRAAWAPALSPPLRAIRLTATDNVADLDAIMGIPIPGPDEVATVLPGLTLAQTPCADPDTDNIVDAGAHASSDVHGSVYLVLRNDYLSLRRALTALHTTTGIVLITEPHRSLERRDVEEVLGRPLVAELHLDPAIARAVDAGLLTSARHLRVDLTLGASPTRSNWAHRRRSLAPPYPA